MELKSFKEFESVLKKPEISMAPLIDMVFLLLIFFVVTTTFTKETGIKVDKAKATTSQHIHKNLIIISINRDGDYWYDNSKRDLDEIISIAVEKFSKNSEINIVLVPDKNGRIEPLVTVMDKLRAKNIHRFSIGTQLVNSDN